MLTPDAAPFIKGRVPAPGGASLQDSAAPHSLNGEEGPVPRDRVPREALTFRRHLPEGCQPSTRAAHPLVGSLRELRAKMQPSMS